MLGTPLYAIIDVDLALARLVEPLDLVSRLLDGGATVLQVRAKRLASRAWLALCEEVVERAHSNGARVVINDRADIARLARADGVHLGQLDLAPRAARAILEPGALIGWSTHTRVQIDDALELPIDYVAVGPVYPTSTKDTGYDAVGLEMVRYAATRFAGRDVVAIGGITLERAREVLDAGATAVAVISDLLDGSNATARVGAYLRVLGHHV
jgi:thiamine-phosphate pyrophosphorylase